MGKFKFMIPRTHAFRSEVVLVWIQSHPVHGRQIWPRAGKMSVTDILLVFSVQMHICYFTTSFEDIQSKPVFFFLPRPYLQK